MAASIQPLLPVAIIATFLLVAAHQVWLVGDFRVDDAYITFSYSKNMAEGNGPVFSHGLRVEGYSNFLWMLILSCGMWFNSSADPGWIARICALPALALTCLVVYLSVRRSSGTWAGLLATALVLCCTDLFRAAISGLETTAFAAALALGWYVYFRERWPLWRLTSLAFVPVALTRIDGFIPVLVVIGFEFFHSLAFNRFTYRRFSRWVAPVVVVWGIYFAWRWHYYGLPLPTTYYAKSMATAHDPQRGLWMLLAFFEDYQVVLLVPILLATLVWGPRAKSIALMLAIGCQLAYSVHVGGDWMPFHRFCLPIVPLGAILCGWGSERIWQHVHRRKWLLRWSIRLGTLGCLGVVALRMHAVHVDGDFERSKLDGAKRLARHTRKNLLKNAGLMRHVLRRPGERLATDYAGVFSVKTGAEIIDMWGLCNADIALNGGVEGINPEYGKSCPQCYARLRPDYFHVVVPIVRGKYSFSSQQELINEIFQGHDIDRVINLRENYSVGRVVEEASGRTLWFLERNREGIALERRDVAPGTYVDYPFL